MDVDEDEEDGDDIDDDDTLDLLVLSTWMVKWTCSRPVRSAINRRSFRPIISELEAAINSPITGRGGH